MDEELDEMTEQLLYTQSDINTLIGNSISLHQPMYISTESWGDMAVDVGGKSYSIKDLIKKVEKTEKILNILIEDLPPKKRDAIKLLLELDEENKDSNND